MKPITALIFATISIAIASQAFGAINPNIIPADACWAAYADLNGLRETKPGKELIAVAEKQQFQKNYANVGVDFQKLLATVGAVTAYGTSFSQKPAQIDGALVVQGTPDLRKIAESVILQAMIAHPEQVAEIHDLPFTAYSVGSGGKEAVGRIIVAFPPEPVVIVSKSQSQILKARAALRGEIPTVATTADAALRPLLGSLNGAFLVAASIVPTEDLFPQGQPQARILRMARSGAVAIGERGPNTVAHAELIAASDDAADKLTKILQGIAAMMSLAETSDEQLAEFLNSTKVTRNGDTVTLDLAYSSERLAQMIRTLVQPEVSRPQMHPRSLAERTAGIIKGHSIAEWRAQRAEKDHASAAEAVRTVRDVALQNGSIISLGSQKNGSRDARFERVEIIPIAGGAPLSFGTDFMRPERRGEFLVFQFPGSDGIYNLKIAFINDPSGKAAYAVGLRNPHDSADESAAK